MGMRRLPLPSSPLLAILGACLLALGAYAEVPWLTNFEDAKKVALKEGKPLLLDFTGSDWCPPCKLLHKNVFETADFAKEAPGKYVLVMLDFPRTKKQSPELKAQNDALQRKYAITGYPTVLLVDPKSGEAYGRLVGYANWDGRKFLDKLETFSNTPEGKSGSTAAAKIHAAMSRNDFYGTCKAIDEAYPKDKVTAALNKALASLRIEPKNKERALKYFDEALAADDGSKAQAIKSLRVQATGAPGPAAKPEADPKKTAEAKKLEKSA